MHYEGWHIDTDNLINILGSGLNSEKVQSFFEEYNYFEEYASDEDLYKISLDLGVDLLFRDGGTRSKYLDTVFLYSEGKDDHKQYKGHLPLGMSFSDSRNQLLSSCKPERTWKIGLGEVDSEFRNPSHDRWVFGNNTISAHYSKKTGAIMYFTIRLKNA